MKLVATKEDLHAEWCEISDTNEKLIVQVISDQI